MWRVTKVAERRQRQRQQQEEWWVRRGKKDAKFLFSITPRAPQRQESLGVCRNDVHERRMQRIRTAPSGYTTLLIFYLWLPLMGKLRQNFPSRYLVLITGWQRYPGHIRSLRMITRHTARGGSRAWLLFGFPPFPSERERKKNSRVLLLLFSPSFGNQVRASSRACPGASLQAATQTIGRFVSGSEP